MPKDQPYLQQAGKDERAIVAEMLRDQHSSHWNECRNFVQRRIYARVKDTSNGLREDIIQEVMLRVWKYLPHFRFESTLRTWVITIIERCIIDVYRKPQSVVPYHFHLPLAAGDSDYESEEPAASEERSAEDAFITNDEIDEGWAALLEYVNTHANRRRNWLILKLVIDEGKTHAEAAEVAGCSSAVVGYIVREAQKYARKKLGHGE